VKSTGWHRHDLAAVTLGFSPSRCEAADSSVARADIIGVSMLLNKAAGTAKGIEPVIFCTLFNAGYLLQGIALYRSLEATARRSFVLYVLCMDDLSADALLYLALPNIRIIRLASFETPSLKAARGNRSFAEYCWTCAAPLIMHVQDLSSPDVVVAYVDADIRFFSDPQAIFDELGQASIFIHEHNFAPAFRSLQSKAGRFNVGLVAVRNNTEGRECLDRWHRQSLVECVMDVAAGRCGDQNYLDEWPQRYPGLVISENPGVGLAPWNVTKYELRTTGGDLTINGVPAVFFHFHSLRQWRPRLGLRAVLMAQRPYPLPPHVVRTIYAPYVAELRRAMSELEEVGVHLDAVLERVGPSRFLGNLVLGRVWLSLNRSMASRATGGKG
jgi:hypothetical protein